MNVIDLFAGCGGLSYGFKKKGIKSVGFLEIDNHCINTLKANFKNNTIKDNRFLNCDIRETLNDNSNNKKLTSFFSEINNKTK